MTMSLSQIVLLVIALFYIVPMAALIYSINTAPYVPDDCDPELISLKDNINE